MLTLISEGGKYPPPGVTCGYDPTDDSLDCASYVYCESGP